MDSLKLSETQRTKVEILFEELYRCIDGMHEVAFLNRGFVSTILAALMPDESKRVMALIRKTAEEPADAERTLRIRE